jgi:hypothetical protein
MVPCNNSIIEEETKKELIMNAQIGIIILTAILTAVANNLFSFFREKKISSYKYAEDTLKKIYIPILEIINQGYFPGDGYNGLDPQQVRDIKGVLENNREMVEPKIEYIVEGYVEEIVHSENEEYDLDRKLLWEVLTGFNRIRKSLGLPYEIKYLTRFYYIVYRAMLNLKLKLRL